MPTGPLAAVTQDLTRLESAQDAAIPTATDTKLLVATWNIRAFGGRTAKWAAGQTDSPERDWHSVACMAAMLFRFGVIALREIRRSTKASVDNCSCFFPQMVA